MTPSKGKARAAIERRLRSKSKALVAFFTAGYPDWDGFERATDAATESGVDVLEIGIPFSDPLADGPTIQASSQKALEAGVNVEELLTRLEKRSADRTTPIILMSYANPILAYGAERFAARARDAGIAGLLMTDLPPEELPEVWGAVRSAGLETVILVAPTTRPERLTTLVEAASGFVYCVSRTGVTGRGGPYAGNLTAQVEAVRARTDLPVVVGFGIRTPEDAAEIAPVADGVVIGARLIELLTSDPTPETALSNLRSFLSGVRAALDGAR